MISKKFAIGALVVAGALGSGLAQARDNVQWSVSIGVPIGVPVYSQPVPVYVEPRPVFVQPAPIYVPRPVFYGRHYTVPTRWDIDGDGIPNRFDRVYNPRWDRDGDGIPNRYDRRDERHWTYNNDRGRDGQRNWQEHGGNR